MILGLAAKESPNTTMLFVVACAGVATRGAMRATIAVAMAASLVLMFTGGVSLMSVFGNKGYDISYVYFCQIKNLLPPPANRQLAKPNHP